MRPSVLFRTLLAGLALSLGAAPAFAHKQDTGFLNRHITYNGAVYKYVVYVPEQWSSAQRWPMILFLHGSGERGADGLDQTQVGLPSAIRSHPERWPFVVVMPQVPFHHHYWTDPDMMAMALAAFDTEVKEFHGDPQRRYLTGLSMGGYGVWEIARTFPGRFAAVVPVASGIFWSYAPSRWQQAATLPAEYAARIGKTPLWIFHGTEDPVVVPRQAEMMYDALKAAGGSVRLWEFTGVRHGSWDRAYALPELPRWLLAHRIADLPAPAFAERVIVPVHPVPARVNPSIYDAYAGDYRDNGVLMVTVFRKDDSLYQKNAQGEITELLPENATTFFYPSGSVTRLTFEKDSAGQVKGIFYRDDRHEEHWQKTR